MNETDEVLYQNYISGGDQTAFATLYDRHQKSLTFYLYTIIGSMEDAEELMLDAFAVAASGTTKFSGKHGALFKTWLYGIAKNKAKMYLRKQRAASIPLSDELALVSEEGLPEKNAMDQEQNRELYEALASIPADYREALYLMYFEDMKPEEIATVMKKSKKQVYNLITRGKQALKEAMEKSQTEGG